MGSVYRNLSRYIAAEIIFDGVLDCDILFLRYAQFRERCWEVRVGHERGKNVESKNFLWHF